MNEKYLQDLYGWIKGKDTSYESRYDYDTFKQKMQDPEYAKSMHGWIATKDPSFTQRRPLDTFIQQVKVNGVAQPAKAVPSKKKFASESPSEDSSLASQQSKKVFAADKRVSNSLNTINQDLMNDTEENVVAKLSKDQNFKELGFSFEESGAMGDYMTVTAPNGQTKEISLDNFLNSKSAAQSVELKNFINKNTTKERRANLEQVAYIEDTNAKIAQYDKKKFGQQFAQEGSKPIDKKNSKYLNDRLKTIDAKLINQNEEYVVPQMNYQFGDLGFKFEESGATGDYMVATAPNGKKMEISLDPFMSSKAVSESAKLQQFIKDNTPDKGLYVIEKAANEENKKYTTQKDVDASIKKVADDANNLNLSLKSFLAKKDKFDKLDKNNPEYMRIQSELILERESLMSKQEQIKTKEVLLKKSVGKYTEMKGQQGTYLAGTWNALMDSFAGLAAGTVDYLVDVAEELKPTGFGMSPKDLKDVSTSAAKKLKITPPSKNQSADKWLESLTEDQRDAVEDEIDDYNKKFLKKEAIPLIRKGNREVYGFSSTTPEWEQLQSEGFWGGAYFGLIKTAPALIAGSGPAGWAQRTAQMYSMVSDGLRQEMDQNPEFEKVSENEKLAVILPIGITGAVLEEFGLKNIKGSTGLINKIAMSALGKAGTTTTAKSFRELVENEVEGKLAKGLLTLTSAGLAEAESGAAQEATETGIKDIYNVIKGKEMFKTPDSIGELIGNVVKAGAQEAVGGFVLGMPTAVSAAYSQKGFLKMDDQNFRIFEAAANDENIQKAFITNLKTKITQGVMTTAEAKEELNNYRNSIGLFKSLPEGLNTQQKKEAMNLLKEKRDLQNQVDGKDPSLVVKLKERIGAIDASLVGISETAANDKAVAESNRQEFDDLPEAQKEKLKEEAGKKIMDMIGDRNDQDVELDEDTVNEVAFRDFVKQKEAVNRISEIETALSTDAETQVTGREKRKLEKELKNLKDAIQEQTTDEGLLRSQQSEMGLQGVGEGNTQPQATSTEETITNAKPEVTIPDSQRQEYDGRLTQYNERIADAKKYIAEEKSKNFLLRSKSEIKYYEGEVKYYEDKIKLLKENPIEFYKQDLDEQKKYHEKRLNEDPEYKQKLIDNYGTTDFEVTDSYFIRNTNQKISDYENAGVKLVSLKTQNDETLDSWNNYKIGESFDVTNPETELPETETPLSVGKYTLVSIPISATDLNYESNKNGVPALSREYWQSTPGLDTETELESLDRIKEGFDTSDRKPIVVEKNADGVYEVMDGHHRLTAATELGRNTILALVKDETITQTQKDGVVQEVSKSETTAFNQGVKSVQQAAQEYKDKITVERREKQKNYQPERGNPAEPKLFERVSKMIADAYQSIKNEPTKQEVKVAYDALVFETKKQYEFIVAKGLKVIRHQETGEPYSNSKEMLQDIRENNTLKFLPNEVAFGQGNVDVSDNIGLQSSGVKLEDGYELTNSEMFRVVHDYFGHGILGNQFGAIGEENATLQHLDLYSDEAAPAVIFQTRGQNSWVNFSGVNAEANQLRKEARELKKQGKLEEANILLEKAEKMFKFAEPKIAIFPTKFNFKRYESARRISEQEDINSRPNRGVDDLPKLLERYSKKSSGTRGINKRSLRGTKRIGVFNVNVIAEYTLDDAIDEGIKKSFPVFKGVQKIFEITDGDTYRKMMEESLKDNPFAASVTVHSGEKFNGMRMFVTEDGSTGITLTKEGFLGGAFSNPNAKRPQNLAQLMVIGIKEGATTAEAFDTVLPDYYSNFGFKAVSRTAFNEEYKPMIKNGDAVKDWDFETYKRFNNGRPDVVFFIYDGGNRNTIEERLGLFDLYEYYEKENTESFDKDSYEKAEEVMNQQAVKRLEFELDINEEAEAEEAAPEELGTQGLSEAELPGYDRMMTEAEKIVKQKKRGRKEAEMYDAVMGYVTRSKVYEDATDVQRERLVRDVRKRFGLREKSAPSVGRLFGTVKNVTKITMTEKAALVKQIKDLGRGAKDAVKAWKIASQELSKQIKELKESGKITSDQAANVIRAFSKVNVFSQKSVDRFTQYMTKVFEKADYANKLNKAKEVRAQIKKLSRNKDKNANLRDLASKFSKIDPSIVTDIDKYNALAAQIKSATDGSKIRGQKIKWSEVVNIADATDYVNQEMEAQDKILKEEKAAELEELLGEDAATIDSLLELDPDQDIPEEDVETVREAIKRVFDTYAESIKSSVVSGVDSFTGEDVSFTKKETETIGKFIAMDIDKMTDKNALQAVDALANFIENRSTAKMAATIATYTGNNNADVVADKGIYAVPLKKLFSPKFGAFLGEQTTTLPMLFEKMFKGFNRGGTVMDAMGLTKLINRKAFAETQANNIVADYIKEFYNSKSKPNGQAFNTAYNNIERGMSAFMLRNVIGTEVEMQAEFDRRKGLVKESIDVLAEGNKLQKKKAELYQKAYDKMVVDSENIQDIKDKTDPKNLEAVNFWHKQWESKFDQMADVASGIYNKILDKDLNYSPDKFTKLKAGKAVDLLNSDSAFINNTNGVLYKNKTGVLEDVTRPSKLPSENKKTTSYIDLSFDKNNSNSMYDALVDIETAEPIRQVQAFLDSDGYSRVVPDPDNADMLAKRIDTYVQNIRSKNPFSNDEFSKTMKSLNKMATLGVGQALGGVTQPIKQVVPVVLNTLINGQGVALGASYDKDFMSWLNGSGYAIANRGIQSQGAIDSLNKMLDEAADSKGKKMFELIEKANAFMLRTFLERPDVFIATASWKTYYEKSLKQQGIDTSDIDYSDHDVNEDAANYAQRMVDRQQNISDQDLAGNLFTDKNAKSQVLRNIFMPFASFRMNQASRFAADLSVLGHWSVSTAEDKKIALLSLSSFATEMAVFKLLSAGIGVALSSAAVAWVGKDESDEEEEKRKNNIYKGQATSAITDIFSPLPVLDKMVQTGAATFLSGVQEGLDVTEEDKLALFNSKPQDYLKNLGLYGMAADRLVELSKLINLSVTGEYTDDYGETKTISDESKDALSTMIGPALLTNIGLGPSELAGIIRNSVKISKKKGKKISKEEIKKSNPKLYERIYGKNTSEGRIKEREDKMDDRMESRLKERESRGR